MKGLTDCRNVKLLKQHDVSDERTNYQMLLLHKSNSVGRIDSALCEQINKETAYWKRQHFFFYAYSGTVVKSSTVWVNGVKWQWVYYFINRF